MASGKSQPALSLSLGASSQADSILDPVHIDSGLGPDHPPLQRHRVQHRLEVTQAQHPAIQKWLYASCFYSLSKPGFPWLSNGDNNSPSPRIIYKTC